MRLAPFITGFAFFATLFSSTFAEETVVAEPEPEPEQGFKVTGTFPSDNPFGHVVNGERNIINLFIENHTKQNVTVLSIAGSFHHPETDRLLKNTTATKSGLKLREGGKIPIQYPFYSQFKPGDVRLKIWLDVVDETQHRVSAYDSIVTVVEAEFSILDWQLWTTYLIVLGILGGVGYFAFLSLFPKPKSKKPRAAAPSEARAPVAITATSSGGYEEEWIPEHHLKKAKKGTITSDADTSGGEASGKEGPRRRKGRK